MKNLNNAVLAFWKEESGLTIVEYALAGALIAAIAVASLTTLGAAVSGTLTTIGSAI